MIDVSDRTRAGVLDGHGLGDHAAHRHADHVGGLHLERIEQTDRVGRHVGEPILGLDRAPGHRPEHRLDLARRLPGELGGETDVAIVERDHPETGGHEAVDELVGPVDQLTAETHHEEQRLAVTRVIRTRW